MPPQDANPTPSFGGFGLTVSEDIIAEQLHHVPTKIGPGVSAFIFDVDGRILMEKRSDSGLWGLPGGSMEIGESAEEAVVREVAEETGLEVEVERLLGVHTDPRKGAVAAYPDGNVVHFVSIVFECRRLSGDLRISHESTDLAYFAVDELPDDIVQGHLMRIQPELPISSCLDPSNAPSSTRAIVVSLTDAVNHPIKLTKPSLGVVS